MTREVFVGPNYRIIEDGGRLIGKETQFNIPSRNPFVYIHNLDNEMAKGKNNCLIKSVKRALDHVNFKNIVQTGNYLAIKVNLGGGVTNIPASGTDPRIVKAIIEKTREYGGKPVVVEANNWGHLMNGRLLKKRGYLSLLKSLKVPFLNLSETKRIYFSCLGHPIELELARFLLSPPKGHSEKIPLVNVAPLKHHWECGVTAAEKNLYGAISDERKSYFHRNLGHFDYIIASAARLYNPDLNIIGGACVCAGQGPHLCQPIRFNRLLISNDMVAIDKKACEILGFPFKSLKYAQINLQTGQWFENVKLMEGSASIPIEITKKFHKLAFGPDKLIDNRVFFSFVYNFNPKLLRFLRYFEFVVPPINRIFFASRERKYPCTSRY